MTEAYRIILVDDEDEVRGRISSKISEDSGFAVVGTAGNGYDALELIERLSPHVVLTDIRMPYIDGIELARIIRRDFPTVRIGFITGYDEFDYAREAVELGARSYLTKPLTQEDIAACLRKLRAELDDEFRDNYDRDQIRRRYEQSVPLIIENCFLSILAHGAAASKDDIELLRSYGVSLDDAEYLCVFAVVERNPEAWNIIEFEKLKLAVRERLGELLGRADLAYHSFMFHEGIACVVKRSGKDFAAALDAILDRLARSGEQFLRVRVDIGVSAPHKDFRQLATACEEAAEALYSGRVSRLSPVSHYGQAEERGPALLRLSEGDAKYLEHQLRYGSDEELARCVEEVRAATEPSTERGAGLGSFALSLAGVLSGHAASLGLDLADAIGEDPVTALSRVRSHGQLFSWFLSSATAARQRGAALKTGNAQRALDRAAAIVHRRYADPELNLEAVCDELAISPSYISQLFRKRMGSSFGKFLTGLRMQKAMDLLSTTNDLIVDVALACGYKDVYYFSHSFKKWTGCSPKKYREDKA